MTGDAVEAALQLLRDLLAAHGPACVCAACSAIEDAEADLEGLVAYQLVARDHLSARRRRTPPPGAAPPGPRPGRRGGHTVIHHPLPYRLLLLDADGTLRRCTVPGQPCPNQPGEWDLLPGVAETLARYGDVPRAIVSNQGGVGLGFLEEEVAEMLLWDLTKSLRSPGVQWQVYFCPHHPDGACPCRKPSPLLLLQAVQDCWMWHHRVPLDEVLYIGDQPSDQEAAWRAGVAYMEAAMFFGWEPAPSPAPRFRGR